MRWTADEEEALREGVKEYGEGFWKKIKESSQALDNRSTVDPLHTPMLPLPWPCPVSSSISRDGMTAPIKSDACVQRMSFAKSHTAVIVSH